MNLHPQVGSGRQNALCEGQDALYLEFIELTGVTFDPGEREFLAHGRFPRLPDTRVIAFENHKQHVLVLSVAHAKRRPLYWLLRVNP